MMNLIAESSALYVGVVYAVQSVDTDVTVSLFAWSYACYLSNASVKYIAHKQKYKANCM